MSRQEYSNIIIVYVANTGMHYFFSCTDAFNHEGVYTNYTPD